MDVNNGMGWLNRHEQKMSVAPIYEMGCRDGSIQHMYLTITNGGYGRLGGIRHPSHEGD